MCCFTLVLHSLWETVLSLHELGWSTIHHYSASRTTDWAARLHWQQRDIAACVATQQLKQISVLGQRVASYALILDITAEAAKEAKVQQQKQLGI